MASKGKVDNLKPFDMLTEEEQRAIRSKGGKASVEARRKKKTMKEQALLLLSLPAHKDIRAKMKKHGIEAEEADNQMAMIVAMFNKTLGGDVQAFNTLMALIGEKPTDSISIDMKPIILKDDVGDDNG